MVSRVLDHLDEHNILSDRPHGFRVKRSCETQLNITTQDLETDTAKCLKQLTKGDVTMLSEWDGMLDERIFVGIGISLSVEELLR